MKGRRIINEARVPANLEAKPPRLNGGPRQMDTLSRTAARATLAAVLLAHAVRAEATVPMNPEYLPEAGLLLAGVFTGAIALYCLFTRQLRKAMQRGGISLACVAAAVLMVGNFHKPPGKPTLLPASERSVALVLGDAVLYLTPSDRYVLSVSDKQFLDLDMRRSGLAVSCVVGTKNKATTGIGRNTISFNQLGIRPSKPDTHTLLVQEEGSDLLRVRFSGPERIEVTGDFFERRSAEPALITFRDGISWSDGHVPPRTVIDLRSQGAGRIDFGGSGRVQVIRLPESNPRSVATAN